MRSLRAALALLAPPALAAVRFKPLADHGDGCQLAADTDVRFVVDLLNAVCAQQWHASYLGRASSSNQVGIPSDVLIRGRAHPG